MTNAEAVEGLVTFHEEVDEAGKPLHRLHGNRLQCCRGCHDCCVDDLEVWPLEADLIRANYRNLLEKGQPHAVGKCAFLDRDGQCRIYRHRPYVCRTQGLPLRWLEETSPDEWIEYRDICPLNEPGPTLESLPAEHCWEIGPHEHRLALLQQKYQGHRNDRISLRSLFRKAPE